MKLATACMLAACSTGGVSLHAQREWLPSHEIDADDLSALHFTAYSADATRFEGFRQYPPGGYVVGGTDGEVEIPDVPDGAYVLQVAYADHSDWYAYDDHAPTWFRRTVGRRDQIAAPAGTLVDLSGVTLGEAWTANAELAAACVNTNSALDDLEITPAPQVDATITGAFDWGGGALIDGSAGDSLVVLHRTEAVFPSEVGTLSGTTATEIFTPPPFTQAPGATAALTGMFEPIVASTSAELMPALFGGTDAWTVDLSVGPGTADGVPGVVLAELSGEGDPVQSIPIVVADPFDPAWPLLMRSQTLLPNSAVVVAVGNADSATARATNTLLIDGQQLGPEVPWSGTQPITFTVDPGLPGFELDFSTSSATMHVYADAASVTLPREALQQAVQYNVETVIGAGGVTTHQSWTGFQLLPN